MRSPRQHKSYDIPKVMSGIRKKRDRVSKHPINNLDYDQRDIEERRDRENATEIPRRMGVRVSRMRMPRMGMSFVGMPCVGMPGVIVRHAIPPVGSGCTSMYRIRI